MKSIEFELIEPSVPASPADNEPRFDHAVAALVRYHYEESMKHAEQVLQRVERLEARGQRIKGAARLRDAHARLSAMLSVVCDDTPAASQKIHPISQVRGELKLGHSQRRI